MTRGLPGLAAALFFVSSLTVFATRAAAQGSFLATLSGTVVDASGGVIPGADIKARNTGTGAETSTVTAVDGGFSIPSLPGGTYTVTVSLVGFKTKVLTEVTLQAAIPATVRVVLEVGTVSETVTVVGQSASVVQIATPAIQTNITANAIINLPLASRNALESLTGLAGFNTPAGTRQTTISGLPRSAVNITLDGMNIQDNYQKTNDGYFARLAPQLDAVEEVTVTTAANTADSTGQGGAQIKFVTRSGSNRLSGSAYQYYRNDALNANTWFNNRDLPPDPLTGKAPKAELNQYQPGFRLGGAIVIPGLWDGHNKAFFFVNYEEFRQPSTSTVNRNILSPGAMNGVFSYNVAGGAVRQVDLFQLAAANGQTSTPDPIIAKAMTDIRAATQTTGQVQDLSNPILQRYTFQTPTQSYNPAPTVRIDYNLAKNHRLMGSFNYRHINSTPDTTNNAQVPFPGFPTTGSQQSTRWTTSESLVSVFGANVVNEFRVGGTGGATFFSPELNASLWSGGANSIGNQGGFRLNFAQACCGGTTLLQNLNTGINISGNSTNQGTAANSSREASTTVIENILSWNRGRHSFTFGTSWTQADVWLQNQTFVPSLEFDVVAGDPAEVMFSPANFQGISTTDLTNARRLYAILTGRISRLTADARLTEAADKYVVLGSSMARGRLRETDFFAQDSWRPTPNLTLNLGLRYALVLPFYATNNSYTTVTEAGSWGVSGVNNVFSPGTLTGQKPGYVQLPQGEYLYNPDRNNWAPSLGITWTPSPRSGLLGALTGIAEGDAVIRSGFATAYQRPGMVDFTDALGSNQGLTLNAERSLAAGTLGRLPVLYRDSSATYLPTFPSTPSYPITPAFNNSLNGFDTNLQIPYTQSWTIGYQRRLGLDTAFEVRYVGSRHRDDWITLNLNELNIVENGFLNEFTLAQQNLQANVAAGRGSTFRYFGPGTGTSPLPIMLAYFQGLPASQAGNPANYTSTNFTTNSTLQNALALNNPNPCCNTTTSFAYQLFNNAGFRGNAASAGLPVNFFVANPDVTSSQWTTNGSGTRYNSLQFEFRKRLSSAKSSVGGLQVNTSYTYGRAYQLRRYSFRKPYEETMQVGTDGGVAHAYKGQWVWDMPFGAGQRFGGSSGRLMDALVGGWSFSGVGRVQTGEMLDFGNVRVIGMSEDEFQQAIGIRRGSDGQLYMLPDDIMTNTVRAFNVSATSPNGYSAQGAPTGRYLAPANGADCIETAPAYGDCGVRSLVLTGPWRSAFDFGIAKRVKIAGSATFEFRAEMLNVFNTPYFLPVTGFTNSTLATNGVGVITLPTGNPTTNTLDAFRIVDTATTRDSARIVQLVWRVSW